MKLLFLILFLSTPITAQAISTGCPAGQYGINQYSCEDCPESHPNSEENTTTKTGCYIDCTTATTPEEPANGYFSQKSDNPLYYDKSCFILHCNDGYHEENDICTSNACSEKLGNLCYANGAPGTTIGNYYESGTEVFTNCQCQYIGMADTGESLGAMTMTYSYSSGTSSDSVQWATIPTKTCDSRSTLINDQCINNSGPCANILDNCDNGKITGEFSITNSTIDYTECKCTQAGTITSDDIECGEKYAQFEHKSGNEYTPLTRTLWTEITNTTTCYKGCYETGTATSLTCKACDAGQTTNVTGNATKSDCKYIRGNTGTQFCDNTGNCFYIPGSGSI